jgi:hypothetical protein
VRLLAGMLLYALGLFLYGQLPNLRWLNYWLALLEVTAYRPRDDGDAWAHIERVCDLRRPVPAGLRRRVTQTFLALGLAERDRERRLRACRSLPLDLPLALRTLLAEFGPEVCDETIPLPRPFLRAAARLSQTAQLAAWVVLAIRCLKWRGASVRFLGRLRIGWSGRALGLGDWALRDAFHQLEHRGLCSRIPESEIPRRDGAERRHGVAYAIALDPPAVRRHARRRAPRSDGGFPHKITKKEGASLNEESPRSLDREDSSAPSSDECSCLPASAPATALSDASSAILSSEPLAPPAALAAKRPRNEHRSRARTRHPPQRTLRKRSAFLPHLDERTLRAPTRRDLEKLHRTLAGRGRMPSGEAGLLELGALVARAGRCATRSVGGWLRTVLELDAQDVSIAACDEEQARRWLRAGALPGEGLLERPLQALCAVWRADRAPRAASCASETGSGAELSRASVGAVPLLRRAVRERADLRGERMPCGSATAAQVHELGELAGALSRAVGAAAYRSWFRELAASAEGPSRWCLHVGDAFTRSWIEKRYGAALGELLRTQALRIEGGGSSELGQ